MSRSLPDVLDALLGYLPPSSLWTRDPTSMTAAMLLPMASAWVDFEVSAEAMLPESDPRSAVKLLPDYERVLGPDPCGRDTMALTVGQRQQLAWQRWTARGGQSIAYFTNLAAQLGVAITIEETICSCCGDECGVELAVTPEQFVWTVHLPQTEIAYAYAGDAECGDYLSTFTPNLVQCPIARDAPAHTIPVFSYTGAVAGG